ncbi:F-box only protein 13-like [Phoenix dactylifera]|uniref:F-box only protein 13-like n=1 Tax=Phoenix dactylifera TaxID=42345 RepID=A0A8B9ATX7_PHODC|nr:F-box only protein 13-like [Phoenix dactylifera]XP_038990261.1 F-box only protein 13-like [Phoenix dactylifera]
MEQNMSPFSGKSKKRKASDDAYFGCGFSLDELNQDLLERVLSWLPPSSFFRLRSVCKRWNSVATSASFQLACSQIPFRDPWFLMVDQDLDRSIVFDPAEANWKILNHPAYLQQRHGCKPIPVASSGGLVCYRTESGDLIVCNPVTGACRQLPPAGQASDNQTLHAITMYSSPKDPASYRIVLVSGEFSGLSFRVFDSATNRWQHELPLVQKSENSSESSMTGDETVYFLSKAGDVVATDMQRSPSKQYSSVLTVENGEEVVYFLSQSGTVVTCNLARKTFSEHPRLLPIFSEYSIDVVECNGEMLVVVLSEFLETASLRVWKFDRSWRQVAAMPPSMSHEFYGKKVDINCIGSGDMIFICINSGDCSSYVLCNVVADEWKELPKCCVNGKAKEFMSAFSFEPRLEASVCLSVS